MLGPEVYK